MKRLRYVSRFAEPLTSEQIDEIVRKSVTNNEKSGITGMLVATGDLFFQLIEGPDEAIDALYEKIRADERHVNVLVVGHEQGELERICPDWAMAKMDLTANEHTRFDVVHALMRAIGDQRRIINDMLAALESVVWRELISARGKVDGASKLD